MRALENLEKRENFFHHRNSCVSTRQQLFISRIRLARSETFEEFLFRFLRSSFTVQTRYVRTWNCEQQHPWARNDSDSTHRDSVGAMESESVVHSHVFFRLAFLHFSRLGDENEKRKIRTTTTRNDEFCLQLCSIFGSYLIIMEFSPFFNNLTINYSQISMQTMKSSKFKVS